MRRHGPVIAHCTDSEDFPCFCGDITCSELIVCRVAYLPEGNSSAFWLRLWNYDLSFADMVRCSSMQSDVVRSGPMRSDVVISHTLILWPLGLVHRPQRSSDTESAFRPHTAIFGGRYSARSALRPPPTELVHMSILLPRMNLRHTHLGSSHTLNS